MAEPTPATTPTPQKSKQSFTTLSINDILYLCLDKWYLFVLSLIICLGAAYFYILHIPPVYTRTSSILIKDDSKEHAPSEADMFSDLSIFNTGTNINNEIETLLSPDIMDEVTRRLRLNVSYFAEGKFHDKVLYGSNLPATIQFIDIEPNESCSCVMEINGTNGVKLSEFAMAGQEGVDNNVVSKHFGDTIATPLGRVIVQKNPSFKGDPSGRIHVLKMNDRSTVNTYLGKLWVSRKNDKASIILLTYTDYSIQRADDILNTLIVVYNENWILDRNRIAQSTSQFIDDRLLVIESELGNVDDDISSYKSSHLLTDVNAAANMYMQEVNQMSNDIKDINNKIFVATSMREFLQNAANSNQMLPVTTDIDELNLGSRINEYNSALREFNSLLTHSSTDNPLLAEMEKDLKDMRASLITSVDNILTLLKRQAASLQGYRGQTAVQIASNPHQAKYLLSVERQQKVKESLYLYLLQKREENELSQAFTSYNTRVLTQPGGSDSPTGPHKRKIMAIAGIIGLIIPLLILFLKESFNTMVRGRGDIEQLSIPFVGEIPLAKGNKQNKKKKKDASNREVTIDVQANGRNVINEAFRVVRTNLEFMVGRRDEGYVVAITSANPNSGKTYNTFNLALSLVLKNKRAIVVDLDLRKGSLSKYADKPEEGISNYLAGHTDNLDDIIVRNVKDTGLDLIPVGTRPPNPTELLENGSLQSLLTVLRKHYDYIFLDCPPVEIVADASIINQDTDMTIFVIRSGLFDRSMLPVVQRYYDDKKYRNMTILLNATDGASRRYGYKYGYRYGYKYGYQYGY